MVMSKIAYYLNSNTAWGVLPPILENIKSFTNIDNTKDNLKAYIDFSESSNLSNFRREENTLIFNIEGVLVPRATKFDNFFGYVGLLDLRDALEKELGSNFYEKIILNIQSPGGIIQGHIEFENLIKEIKNSGIKIETFSETVLASLAYYIAAATDKIITTPTSIVGSIGVILSIRKTYNDFIVFKKGDLKAAGENTPLSLKEMQFLDNWLTKEYNFLTESIAKNRNKPVKEVIDTEGRSSPAHFDRWFVDEIVNSINELII